jgi:hypothetical protein
MRGMRHGPQLDTETVNRRGRDRIGKIRRQLAAGHCLDGGKHIGWTASEEIAHDEFGRNRNSNARKFVRGNRCSELLTVDQHTVAIEDDHGNRANAPPQHRPDQAVQRINAPALEIARKWQNSGVTPRRDSFAQIV